MVDIAHCTLLKYLIIVLTVTKHCSAGSLISNSQDSPTDEMHSKDVPSVFPQLHAHEISHQENDISHKPEFNPPSRGTNDHNEFNLTFTEESSSDLDSDSETLLFDNFEAKFNNSSEGHLENNVSKQLAEVVVRNELNYREKDNNDVSAESATITSQAMVTIL